MKTQIYYRYCCNKMSVFSATTLLFNRQTTKWAGTSKWMKEQDSWTTKINKNIEWLAEPRLRKGCKFYFKQPGSEKYKNSLLKIHKQILGTKKINEKKYRCFERKVGRRRFLYYFSSKRRLGEIVYEDKYQIAVK